MANAFGSIVGIFVTVLHMALACSLLYAILCCNNRNDAFMIFAIVSVIMLGFLYFQTCALSALETMYSVPGHRYIDYLARAKEFLRRTCIRGEVSLEKELTLQVVAVAMALAMMKVCLLILRDFLMCV